MNWIVGEYGDTLRVTLPFAIDGDATIKVRKPGELTWLTWTTDVTEAGAVEHVILSGELSRVGVYRGVVEVDTGTQLRKALFTFSVAGLGGADIEGATS